MLIRGIAHWAKIVGKPSWGYKKQYKEWSFDLALDAETAKKLRQEGFSSQIKNKGDERGDFITFKRKELKKDGTPGKPFLIFDHKGQEWDGKTLIGNGSTLNVKLAVNEFEDGAKKLSAVKIQVWDLVKYEGKSSGDGDDDFPVKDATEEEEWA